MLISSPAKAWEEISLEDRRAVFSAFVYPMIGLCGISVFIGILIEGGGEGNIIFQRAMTACCAVFVALFGGYFLAAYGINQLGVKMFGLKNNLSLIQQFAGYAMVVTFLLDIITGILPGLFHLELDIPVLHYIYSMGRYPRPDSGRREKADVVYHYGVFAPYCLSGYTGIDL